LLSVHASLQEEKEKRPEWKDALMLSIPTLFDLVATILMNIGLLTVTASVYQMMRGAEMLFAALFAVLFLCRSLNRFHYGGIGFCVIGIALVGLSSVLSGQGGAAMPVSEAQIVRGMGLIVLSQAVQAAQITFEDYFMSALDMSPMKIVGFEGAIGSLIMIFVLLPIVRLLPGVLPTLAAGPMFVLFWGLVARNQF
jgi:drug/metabolite transporter (DMT)-like permease